MSDTLTTWPRRYNFQEWRRFPQNQNLTEHEAQELFRRESLKYTLHEQELMQLHSQQQATINNSINSLQSYIFNVFNVANVNNLMSGRTESPILRALREAQEEAERIALPTPASELLTENRLLLVTEANEYLITE
jgi:5-formyltetrahydrofolate cyclo-ligase